MFLGCYFLMFFSAPQRENCFSIPKHHAIHYVQSENYFDKPYKKVDGKMK